MTGFAELGLSQGVLEAIEALEYREPMPIQVETIPVIMRGRDIIGQAQTGSGKTAAFGLPAVEQIDETSEDIQVLVLTPTRELCIQVAQALRTFSEFKGVKVVAVFGGQPIPEQTVQLRQGPQIVVGTPGRVMDLIRRGWLQLSDARYVVLDEADEMLSLGFMEDVEWILKKTPSGRQTLLFSATMPAPIRKLADRYLYEPVHVKVESATLTVETIDQVIVDVEPNRKLDVLCAILERDRPAASIVFRRRKMTVDELVAQLGARGFDAVPLHGDMPQGRRDGVMLRFRSGRAKLLVATNVAARGLDISHVSHVFSYDVPGRSRGVHAPHRPHGPRRPQRPRLHVHDQPRPQGRGRDRARHRRQGAPLHGRSGHPRRGAEGAPARGRGRGHRGGGECARRQARRSPGRVAEQRRSPDATAPLRPTARSPAMRKRSPGCS